MEFEDRFAAIVEGVLRGLDFAGDHRANNSAIARALQVDESRVRHIRKNGGWRAGDVLAMAAHPETRDAARKIIATQDALVSEMAPCMRVAPEMRVLGVVVRTGELAAIVREAIADGTVDEEESGRISTYALALVSDTNALVRDTMLPPALAKASPRATAVGSKLGVAGGAR